MTDITTEENFNCSVDEFYKIISDYESYPEFVNEITKSEVLKREGNKCLVEFGIKLMKEFSYKLWMIENKPQEIAWTAEENKVFKNNSGSWKLESIEGRCKATYSLKYELKIFVPNVVEKTLAEINLPNIMSSYHKRVNDLYE